MKRINVTQPLVPNSLKFDIYLKEIFKSKQFSNNSIFLKSLESNLKSLLKVQYASAFNNGTTALMIALKSLGLQGYCITTPFTFPATANAILWAGLKPIFCDINYETMNITPKTVIKTNNFSKIAYNISTILPVHVFGNPCDVKDFKKLSNEYNFKLVYDAAHAFGVEIDGKGIGTFGDITMFSFHPTKLFHTGEGGLLTYNNSKLDTIIKQLRNFGIKDDQIGSVRPGINGKMNELSAAMGLCILDKVKAEKASRELIHKFYTTWFSEIPEIKLLNIPDNVNKKSWQYFPIRIKKYRNKVYDYLVKNNVYSRKYFWPLCCDFKHFKHLKTDVPNARKVSKEILCLPFYGNLTTDDVERICNLIKKGVKS